VYHALFKQTNLQSEVLSRRLDYLHVTIDYGVIVYHLAHDSSKVFPSEITVALSKNSSSLVDGPDVAPALAVEAP